MSEYDYEEILRSTVFNKASPNILDQINRLTPLISAGGKTVQEALATIPNRRMRKTMRPILYAIQLTAIVGSTERLGGITPEQKEDCLSYLWESILRS